MYSSNEAYLVRKAKNFLVETFWKIKRYFWRLTWRRFSPQEPHRYHRIRPTGIRWAQICFLPLGKWWWLEIPLCQLKSVSLRWCPESSPSSETILSLKGKNWFIPFIWMDKTFTACFSVSIQSVNCYLPPCCPWFARRIWWWIPWQCQSRRILPKGVWRRPISRCRG